MRTVAVALAVMAIVGQAAPDPDFRAPLNTSTNYLPRWSPDGRLLVFDHRTADGWRIHIIGADGRGLRQASHGPGNDYQAAWSPDGEWLAFDSDRHGNREVYRMPVAGGQTVRLTAHGSRDVMPA